MSNIERPRALQSAIVLYTLYREAVVYKVCRGAVMTRHQLGLWLLEKQKAPRLR